MNEYGTLSVCVSVWVWECVWESVVELRVCFPDRVQQWPTGARGGSRVSHVCFSLFMRAFHIRGSECVGVWSSAWTTLACVYLHSCLVYTCRVVCVYTLHFSWYFAWECFQVVMGIQQTNLWNLLKSSRVSSIWQTGVECNQVHYFQYYTPVQIWGKFFHFMQHFTSTSLYSKVNILLFSTLYLCDRYIFSVFIPILSREKNVSPYLVFLIFFW